MNVEQFRQIIREEVSRAMQKELREILTEAVEIASRPEQNRVESPKQQPVREVRVPVEESQVSSVQGLSSLLEQTAADMTQDEYEQVLGIDSSVPRPDLVSEGSNPSSVDPLPDFVARAAKIFAAANEKDKERHGV